MQGEGRRGRCGGAPGKGETDGTGVGGKECGESVVLGEGLSRRRGRSGGRGCVRRGHSDGSSGPRGLTVNESEGPQEHDPGQPESARSETGITARGLVPRPPSRRRPRLGARILGLPPPQGLLGGRHRWAASTHAPEAPSARTPRPKREAAPARAGHAHGRGARSGSRRARAPRRPQGMLQQ